MQNLIDQQLKIVQDMHPSETIVSPSALGAALMSVTNPLHSHISYSREVLEALRMCKERSRIDTRLVVEV